MHFSFSDKMEKGKANDSIMLDVNARLQTFRHWPFNEDNSCTPKRMAEAGFYFCGGDNEPDLVRCYFCRKELDGWEPEDDPWEEHKSHTRGKCPYVNLGKRPHELSVQDVLGTLEPGRAKCLINKIFENWQTQFKGKVEEKKREVDACAPKYGNKKNRK